MIRPSPEIQPGSSPLSRVSLQTLFAFSPVSPLGVEPDFITNFHPNPLGKGPILLLLLGQEPLDPENLVRRHDEERTSWTTMAERERRQQSL